MLQLPMTATAESAQSAGGGAPPRRRHNGRLPRRRAPGSSASHGCTARFGTAAWEGNSCGGNTRRATCPWLTQIAGANLAAAPPPAYGGARAKSGLRLVSVARGASRPRACCGRRARSAPPERGLEEFAQGRRGRETCPLGECVHFAVASQFPASKHLCGRRAVAWRVGVGSWRTHPHGEHFACHQSQKDPDQQPAPTGRERNKARGVVGRPPPTGEQSVRHALTARGWQRGREGQGRGARRKRPTRHPPCALDKEHVAPPAGLREEATWAT